MPMIMPPMYFDVPAIIQIASHSSGASTASSTSTRIAHFMPPIARPLGVTQGPNIAAPLRTPVLPRGVTQGPNVAALSRAR